MTPRKGLSSDITGLLGFFGGFTCWKSPDSCNQPLRPGLGAARQLSHLPGWQEFGPGTFTQHARQPSCLSLPRGQGTREGAAGGMCRWELILLQPPRLRDGFQGVEQSTVKAEEASVFLARRWPSWPTGIKPVTSFTPGDPSFWQQALLPLPKARGGLPSLCRQPPWR